MERCPGEFIEVQINEPPSDLLGKPVAFEKVPPELQSKIKPHLDWYKQLARDPDSEGGS